MMTYQTRLARSVRWITWAVITVSSAVYTYGCLTEAFRAQHVWIEFLAVTDLLMLNSDHLLLVHPVHCHYLVHFSIISWLLVHSLWQSLALPPSIIRRRRHCCQSVKPQVKVKSINRRPTADQLHSVTSPLACGLNAFCSIASTYLWLWDSVCQDKDSTALKTAQSVKTCEGWWLHCTRAKICLRDVLSYWSSTLVGANGQCTT